MSILEPKDTLINPRRAEEILKSVASRNPELAQRLALFYTATEKCCIALELIFPNGEIDYHLRVRAIDPFLRGREDFMVGATIYLGVSNNYIEQFINAGQVVILLRSDGDLECEGYIYKSVDSVIVRDNQLDELSEWIRITQYRLEREIPRAMVGIRERTITRKNQPSQSRAPQSESKVELQEIPKPSKQPQVTEKPKIIPVESKQPKTKGVKIIAPRLLDELDDKRSEDPTNAITDNIPSFKIERSKGKVTPIPDPLLFATKKKK